jgi:hypothetical protein
MRQAADVLARVTFRRMAVKMTPRRGLELVRFAAQPPKGPRSDWNALSWRGDHSP